MWCEGVAANIGMVGALLTGDYDQMHLGTGHCALAHSMEGQ